MKLGVLHLRSETAYILHMGIPFRMTRERMNSTIGVDDLSCKRPNRWKRLRACSQTSSFSKISSNVYRWFSLRSFFIICVHFFSNAVIALTLFFYVSYFIFFQLVQVAKCQLVVLDEGWPFIRKLYKFFSIMYFWKRKEQKVVSQTWKCMC